MERAVAPAWSTFPVVPSSAVARMAPLILLLASQAETDMRANKFWMSDTLPVNVT
jgi:hypothetical protein